MHENSESLERIMTSAREQSEDHPSLDSVTRRVMWGEDSEEILESLITKGIPADDAEVLVDLAMRDRAQTIRGIFWPRIGWGIVLIIIGSATTWGCWMLTEGYSMGSSRIIILPAGVVAYGLVKLLNGLIGVITAGSRTGPIADIN